MDSFAAIPQYTEKAVSNSTVHPSQLQHQSPVPSHVDSTACTHRHRNVSINDSIEPSITLPTSKDARPKKETPSRLSQWICEWVTDWWGVELACSIIAALSLVAIVIVLESHKSKPLPEWPFEITLNSLISVFATLGQMAMMKPVVECISQLKWLWFVRKEKLRDFQIFDDASRGPTGSLVLLGKIRGLHLITLGAAITVLSIAFGAFSQQVVTYPIRPHPDPTGNATTPLVLNYTGLGDLAGELNQGIVAAMYNGLANTSSDLSSVAPFCSTGNCTWNTYPSLGICANVVDISSSILKNPCNLTAFEEVFEAAGVQNPGYPCFNYTLPFQADNTVLTSDGYMEYYGIATFSNVASLNPGGGPPALRTMSLATKPDTSNGSLIDAYLIYQPDLYGSLNSSLASPIAYEFSLDVCVQEYNTTVFNGVAHTSMLSSQILDRGLSKNLSDQLIWIYGNATALSADGFSFNMTKLAFANLELHAKDFFVEECYDLLNNTPTGDTWPDTLNGFFCEFLIGPAFVKGLNSTDPLSAVNTTIQSLATSMTNEFRMGAGGDTQVFQFQGIALSPQPYVGTNYTWFTFPISLVSLTFIFLIATIFKSQRLGSRVWKSSNMATLQGLHRELHNQLGGLTSTSEMDEKAELIKVRFDMEGGKAEHGLEYRLVEHKREEYWRG